MTAKSSKKQVSVLYSPGTNCEEEIMEAFRLAGGIPSLVYLKDLRERQAKITDCDCFVVPGGFSYGDYPDPGVAVAEFLRTQFAELAESGIPTIGICNGMQILVRAGVFGSDLVMGQNDSGRFVSKTFGHYVIRSNCVWTKGLEGETLQFAAAHGFGKLVGEGKRNVVMEYDGDSPCGDEVAAICNDTGRIMALMDHPERRPSNPDGLAIFRRGLEAA